ncbi:hydrophobic surface binding protein A-domain-containing protein [Aspergillus granulosus]|uniref:Hydrophobic surface binding protein A-domain-containing protein n=1 Tax=Aspergillus granulosus TaxID=176169 RepID=A0ABR4H5V6_9EURO
MLSLTQLFIFTLSATATSHVLLQRDTTALSILEDITTETRALNYLLTSFEPGDSTSSLESSFSDLITTIEASATTLEETPTLSLDEAESLGDPALALRTQITSVTETLVERKPDFVDSGTAGTIKSLLESFDTAATELMAVYVSKFPEELNLTAGFLDAITDPIGEAVAEYADVEDDDNHGTDLDSGGESDGQQPLVIYWNTF